MKNPQKRREKWCVSPEKVVRKPWVPMAPPAVIQNPAGLDRVESGRYKGMRSQPIDKTNIPWQM